ncbi:hypothetical protein E2320_018450 [Naja naja]|nr:hypothetical protein E2320_018450 [Naja naja]
MVAHSITTPRKRVIQQSLTLTPRRTTITAPAVWLHSVVHRSLACLPCPLLMMYTNLSQRPPGQGVTAVKDFRVKWTQMTMKMMMILWQTVVIPHSHVSVSQMRPSLIRRSWRNSAKKSMTNSKRRLGLFFILLGSALVLAH